MPNVGDQEYLITFPLNISVHIEALMVVLGEIGLLIALSLHPVANYLNHVAVYYDPVVANYDLIAHNPNPIAINLCIPRGEGSTFLFFYFHYFYFLFFIASKINVDYFELLI